jgi:ATP-dependent Clp protease adaptor protein ClpS
LLTASRRARNFSRANARGRPISEPQNSRSALGEPLRTDYNRGLRRDCWSTERLVSNTVDKPPTKVRPKTVSKTQRPPLYKVILLNDDYTPREFVVQVLKAVFRMNEDQAHRVMMTAHRRGACVIAVYTRDVAETKAKEATELGKSKGYPLFFTTEPEQ